MPTNVFFNHAVNTEQHLYEDLVVESLRIYGHECYYLPRNVVEEDTILGEDIQSTYGDAYSVEMYIENVEGFEGEGDLFSKFGVQVRDQATFVISLRTWERFISLDGNLATSLRPNEGDIIFFPMSGSVFEIKFVEHENPFYQVGKLFVFKMQCELFEYSGEDFDTGIESIDIVEDEQAYTIQMNMADGGSGAYTLNENLTLSGVVVGEVVAWRADTRLLTIKDNTKTLQVNDVLVGASSTASYTIQTITDVLTMGNDAMSQNKEFEDKDTSYLDFSEVNPFGEP
jgi:hypothetical protein|tara:strand:- start:338 stop:1192 length:855 start_codon:yes stop_codon:yes gene_type:complete